MAAAKALYFIMLHPETAVAHCLNLAVLFAKTGIEINHNSF